MYLLVGMLGFQAFEGFALPQSVARQQTGILK